MDLLLLLMFPVSKSKGIFALCATTASIGLHNIVVAMIALNAAGIKKLCEIDHDQGPAGFQSMSSDTPLMMGARNDSTSVAISWKDAGT